MKKSNFTQSGVVPIGVSDHYLIHTVRNKRPTGLNGHLSIRDFTLASCQKGSYLYIISPIIE